MAGMQCLHNVHDLSLCMRHIDARRKSTLICAREAPRFMKGFLVVFLGIACLEMQPHDI
jgi:hypothetical protein